MYAPAAAASVPERPCAASDAIMPVKTSPLPPLERPAFPFSFIKEYPLAPHIIVGFPFERTVMPYSFDNFSTTENLFSRISSRGTPRSLESSFG